ncbi:hypothetical protein DO70_4844 [Burkholderia pseudomallei]|nr:hypothetical protein DO70_4844 [Burkholderia pseudomallei]KGR93620.1 hypothetical protein X948_5484 [Burkholderia pseudomallei MSHR5608]
MVLLTGFLSDYSRLFLSLVQRCMFKVGVSPCCSGD